METFVANLRFMISRRKSKPSTPNPHRSIFFGTDLRTNPALEIYPTRQKKVNASSAEMETVFGVGAVSARPVEGRTL